MTRGCVRPLTEQHALGTDHVRDIVVHGPSRTIGRCVPLLRPEIGADLRDVVPHLVEADDHRFHGRARRRPPRRETAPVTDAVDFYFDPMCPYAYQTSVWIRDGSEQIGLDITWRFFSLEEVNLVAGKRHPWERPWSFGFGQMRVGALIRRELGNDELDRWYDAVGHAFFYDGVQDPRARGARGGDRSRGLRPRARRPRASPTTPRSTTCAPNTSTRPSATARTVCRRSCSTRATRCTARWSCPRPTGDDAVALWELVRSMARFPHLYELRHPKTRDDLVHVAERLRDLPHDARLEHGREPGAVAVDDQSSRAVPTATTLLQLLRRRPSSRRRRGAAARTPAPGTTRHASVVRNATSSAACATATSAPRALSILAAFRPGSAARLHRELVDGGALGESLLGRDHDDLFVARPRSRRSTGRRPSAGCRGSPPADRPTGRTSSSAKRMPWPFAVTSSNS